MRQVRLAQNPLLETCGPHQHNRELEEISKALDANPQIAELAYKDLMNGKQTNTGDNAELAANQVVRILVLRMIHKYTYRKLEFHLIDSSAFRRFSRLRMGQFPKKSVLQKDIKALGPEVLEAINIVLVKYAKEMKIEKGRKIRTDCTGAESNIHPPTDSSLLKDCVRVITRILGYAAAAFSGAGIEFHDHTKRANKRALEIQFPSKKKTRKRNMKRAYKDLLRVAGLVFNYGQAALEQLRNFKGTIDEEILAKQFVEELTEYLNSMARVIDQTERRVLKGEQVPASEKLVSIFETHTDIIVKDRRDVLYGHKICVTGTASSLITDCVIEDGNPADSTLVERTIRKQIEIYGKPPLKASFDGGFASQEGLRIAKEDLHVKDVCFHKKCGLKIADMVKSAWVFKKMKNFRAGIEGLISVLKRGFGMGRCPWRGERAFKSYVWSCIISFNLMVIARHLMA